MNSRGISAALVAGVGLAVHGATIYVSPTGTNDVANRYNTWEGAATNIVAAVAIATDGDVVLVTNGSYAVGSTVRLTNGITLVSVNGPAATAIYRDSGVGSMGVLEVSNASAVAAGFTVTNGYYTGARFYGIGARLYCGTVSNCVFALNRDGGGYPNGGTALGIYGGLVTHSTISNNAMYAGPVYISGGILQNSLITSSSSIDWGGINMSGSALVRRCIFRNLNVDYSTDPIVTLNGGTMENCLIHDCTSQSSSGRAVNQSGGRLVNCTITRNTSFASVVAGVDRSGGVITNCIIYGNGNNTAAANYNGAVSGVVFYSCSPGLTAGVQGNIVGDPQFVNPAGGDFRLKVGSPARDAGTNLAGVVDDLVGTARPLDGGSGSGARHDMGAYEMDGTTGSFEVGFYGVPPLSGINSLTVVFHANAAGADRAVTWYGWDFNNDGSCELSGPGLATVTNMFGPGRYSVVLLATNGSSQAAACTNLDCVSVVSTSLYVSTTGAQEFPYDTPAKAARNIHDAVNSAAAGCTIWVGNGDFATTNQILIAQPLRILGSGPDSTTVHRDAAAGNFGIFYLSHPDALVAGMAVTNGYGNSANAAAFRVDSGAVSNCLVTGSRGTGFWFPVTIGASGRVVFTAVSNNATYSGGVNVSAGGVIEDSLIAGCSGTDRGGLYLAGTGRRLRVIGNSAHGAYGPGGVHIQAGGRLENSIVYSNRFTVSFLSYPPGVYMGGGVMLNCTVAGNIADPASTKGSGLQLAGGVITNCIIYGNSGAGGTNFVGSAAAAWYSCAPELTNSAQGNVTGNPRFQDAARGDFHLRSGSPCINSGITLAGMQAGVDLEGKPRVIGGTVDMGAFEASASGTVIFLK